MPCVTQVRIPTTETPAQNVAVSKEGGRRPLALNERATLFDQKEKGKERRSNLKGVFFTRGEIRRVKITLQIEDTIRGIITNLEIHSCADQPSDDNSINKDCKENKNHESLLQKKIWNKHPAWNVFIVIDKLNVSHQHMSTTSKISGRKPAWTPCHRSVRCIWDARIVNQLQKLQTCKSVVKTNNPWNTFQEEIFGYQEAPKNSYVGRRRQSL